MAKTIKVNERETLSVNEAMSLSGFVRKDETVAPVVTKDATVTRDRAYKTLLAWVTAQTDVPADVLTACKTVRPSYFGLGNVGAKGDGLTPAYRKLLALGDGNMPANGTTWTEMELFTKYRFGRTEAKNWCNELAKLPCDDPITYPRIWVKFNVTERSYTLVSVDNSVPMGWVGYVPKDLSTDGKAVQASNK